MVAALMTLTAIGSYGLLTRAHLQHQLAAQEAVNRDARACSGSPWRSRPSLISTTASPRSTPW
jgi:hypothetical protein